MSYPAYEAAPGDLFSRESLLRLPARARVEIECDDKYASRVAVETRLSDDPSADTFESLWGGRRPRRFTVLPGPAPLDLRINGVFHFAAPRGDHWSLIRVNASGIPVLKKVLGRTDYFDDDGNLVTEKIGDIGGGLLAALTISRDDPPLNSCLFSTGQPASASA